MQVVKNDPDLPLAGAWCKGQELPLVPNASSHRFPTLERSVSVKAKRQLGANCRCSIDLSSVFLSYIGPWQGRPARRFQFLANHRVPRLLESSLSSIFLEEVGCGN